MESATDKQTPLPWLVTANIKAGSDPEKSGSRHFSAGRKVWITDLFYGVSPRVQVVGRVRKSGRLIGIMIAVELIENIRVKALHSDAVYQKLSTLYPGGDVTELFDYEKAMYLHACLMKIQNTNGK